MKLNRWMAAGASLALGLTAAVEGQTPVGTAVTYQGRLEEGGLIADGAYDFQFRLFDASAAGLQVGSTLSVNDLNLSDGVFSVNLDFGSASYNVDARWLEIAVRDGASAGAYTTLTPRQRLRAAPFAIQSLKDANWALAGGDISNTNTGDVGIGTTNPLGRLHISHTANPDITFENSGDTTADRRVSLNFRHASGIGAEIEAERDTGASDGMSLAFSTEPVAGSLTERMRITETGDVGIGSASPNAKLHVRSEGTTSGVPPIGLRVTSEFPSGTGTSTEYIQFEGTEVTAIKDNANATLEMQKDGGRVHIGNLAVTSPKLTVSRDFQFLADSNLTSEDVLIHDTGTAWLGLYSDNIGGVGPGITLGEYGATNYKWGIYARTTDNVGDLNITFGTDNSPTANEKMLQIDRDGTTKVKVLEILGADVSERFPMSSCVEAGMVVMIDAANAGGLCLAQGEYNTKVAGVISGAGDIPVGAILGNMKGLEDAPPVALSGRVWTWCDATTNAIEAGDLLTTSATPGHAMKAADAERRGGAVIGKAMTGLATGEKGLVLVLVNLQ